MTYDLDLTGKPEAELIVLQQGHAVCGKTASVPTTKMYHYAMWSTIWVEFRLRRNLPVGLS